MNFSTEAFQARREENKIFNYGGWGVGNTINQEF